MMTMEQARFFEVVREALGAYVKAATPLELESWWGTCRQFSLDDVERALKSHCDDGEDGKRAPRPIDVKRRLAVGVRSGLTCAARNAGAQCQYPGIFSDGTLGSDSWWCPWHRLDRAGPEATRWIEVSHQVPWAVASERRAARVLVDAQRSPSVRLTSWGIALRHGDKPWQPGKSFVLPGQPAPVNMDAEPA